MTTVLPKRFTLKSVDAIAPLKPLIEGIAAAGGYFILPAKSVKIISGKLGDDAEILILPSADLLRNLADAIDRLPER